jgi:hypothetical protein
MKETRLYCLVEKNEAGKWIRISKYAYRKSSAVKLFQNSLLAGAFGGRIRELHVTKVQFDPTAEELC